ncbi:MAG: hypothetical protein IK041_01235 [Bacteroidales bacterium]|nr:hypothetical protein [Bacteroidales bacterium]
MRKELYEDLIAALKLIKDNNNQPKIKHIDLWNQNVAFITEDESWPMPAVFIEFGQIDWKPLKGASPAWTGEGTILLHIVTQWHGSAADGSPEMDSNLECWSLADEIQQKIEGGSGSSFRNISLLQTQTNHNHEDIVENIEIYSVKLQRTL